jgi:septal ring factor EnvC (AmiA/AmiB activator)
MADPQTLAQSHPVEVWTALGGSVTVIMTLVAVLYARLNSDLKQHELKLEAGQKEFEKLRERQTRAEEKIAQLKDEDTFHDEELDRLELELKTIDKDFRKLETEHKNCIPRRISMRGQTE